MGRPRLQLDIGPEAVQRLDALAEATGCTTRAELVRRALYLYEYLAEARQLGGGVVLLEMPDGQRDREVIVPGLRRGKA